ncbi:hypothetical protein BXZ70DRAFT_195272 [Cristinia sonorae]|uniref:SH3 domain-containing protein n=1 Tax=Cristinia sonorae TaxID=1940300 RepID=A0A8K0UN17_9AGAR|nr:hypothetical protein BXZ70DRAFT_195272 [Cristinia sonorae]
MAPYIISNLAARNTPRSGETSPISPIFIAGIAVVGAIVLALGIWLTVRWFRKRAGQLKSKDVPRPRDFEKMPPTPSTASLNSANPFLVKNQFSRSQLDASVAMPVPRHRPDASREEIVRHYAQGGNIPRPFSVASENPFHDLSSQRSSVASSLNAAPMGKRKIRQAFNPALPDELVVSVGEYVGVVNIYADEWCIVGRDGLNGAVELGAVPIWCFNKPTSDGPPARSMRVESLGVTVTFDGPADSRDGVMSWANF